MTMVHLHTCNMRICLEILEILHQLYNFILSSQETNPFRIGIRLFLVKTLTDICPLKTILPYLVTRGSKSGPLFLTTDGSPLTRQRFHICVCMYVCVCIHVSMKALAKGWLGGKGTSCLSMALLYGVNHPQAIMIC